MIPDTLLDDRLVVRSHLPHQQLNEFWLNAGYTDVCATIRLDSKPVLIREIEARKDPEWTVRGELEAATGSNLSIVLRDDRTLRLSGIHIDTWVNQTRVGYKSFDRFHRRLITRAWADERAFVFKGDENQPIIIDAEDQVTTIKVALFSIRGGATGADPGRMDELEFLHPGKPPLFSFEFIVHWHAPRVKPNCPQLQQGESGAKLEKKKIKKRERDQGRPHHESWFIVSDDDEEALLSETGSSTPSPWTKKKRSGLTKKKQDMKKQEKKGKVTKKGEGNGGRKVEIKYTESESEAKPSSASELDYEVTRSSSTRKKLDAASSRYLEVKTRSTEGAMEIDLEAVLLGDEK